MKFKNLIYFFFIASLCFASTLNANFSGKMTENSITRDPLKQPFSSNSIWNMPIGSDAKFVPAEPERAMAAGMTIDEDIIAGENGTSQYLFEDMDIYGEGYYGAHGGSGLSVIGGGGNPGVPKAAELVEP